MVGDTSRVKPAGRYVRLDARGAPSFSPRQLWRDSVGHGISRASRALRRQRRAPGECLAPLRRAPKRVAGAASAAGAFYAHNWRLLQREVLCGVAAMLLQIPETVAFSYVANLDPVVGLYATGFFGIIVGLLGGVPATVAGAAGALAVVMPQLTGGDGALAHLPLPARVDHLVVAVTLAGALQLAFGALGLSRAFAMIPRTAHIGFLNGLALMMFLSQMSTFKVCTDPALRFGACEIAHRLAWMDVAEPATWTTAFVVVLTMVVMHGFPKLPMVGKLVPPTLVVALLGVGFEHGINRPLLGYNVRTIGDTSPLAGGLPSFGVPDFGGVQDWAAVLSCAASLAAVGLFESIMTLQAVVDLTKARLTPEACRKECVAQGVGNLVCGFFAAMGGCSMIGQSTGNVLNGGRFRVSAVVSGVATFVVVLFASALIELVPVACLTGILFVIILHTFYWPSLRLVFHLQAADAFAIVLVTALAAAINLAVAVVAGVVWQSLVNGWRDGQQLAAHAAVETVTLYRHPVEAEQHGDGGDRTSSANANQSEGDTDDHESDAIPVEERVKVYYVRGQLLFSSVALFRAFFDVDADSRVVIVDLHECLVGDFSGVAALREAATRYRDAGKLLVARRLCAQSLDLLRHDVGWDHVESIHVAGSAHDDEEAGLRHSDASAHYALPSPLPHLHLVSPFSPSTTSSPTATSSYHVLH
ncbi:hypothetical protein PybrP1_010168 [[Pythium] brassicae (nom. inval.)]|nr:hypothetical protein PybrP1_010168 [[Pythium] brassicae (nom. inval.)]